MTHHRCTSQLSEILSVVSGAADLNHKRSLETTLFSSMLKLLECKDTEYIAVSRVCDAFVYQIKFCSWGMNQEKKHCSSPCTNLYIFNFNFFNLKCLELLLSDERTVMCLVRLLKPV